MNFFRHPLWLVGFRPFFTLACVAGALLPPLWILIFRGTLPAPTRFTPLQWHAHEMFFGFGWAVLGGFLLTSTKNWVNIRGYHGPALAWLVACWLLERLAMGFGGDWPLPLFLLANHLFLGSIVAMLMWTLIRHRDTDSYRDNAIFLVMLPAFLLAKNLLLGDHPTAGYSMALSLYRVAFLVMFERTLTQFMKAGFQAQILRNPRLDLPIKLLALLLVFEFLLPIALTVILSLLLATLLLIRFFFWHPAKAFTRIDIGIMYVGYLAIAGQLLLSAWQALTPLALTGTVATHLFTFGAMGCVIPAMIVRIGNGHTGRKVVFAAADRAVLWIMLLALILRLLGPQLAPAAYLHWLDAAAACWLLAFALLGWRCIPMLWQARIDGREH